MKRKKYSEFEPSGPTKESSRVNQGVIQEFDEAYRFNCQRFNRDLTNSQNTSILLCGLVIRLLLPPRTHHGDRLEQLNGSIYKLKNNIEVKNG